MLFSEDGATHTQVLLPFSNQALASWKSERPNKLLTIEDLPMEAMPSVLTTQWMFVLFDKINFYSLTRNICKPLESWFPSHSTLEDAFVVITHTKQTFIQSWLASLQSSGRYQQNHTWWLFSWDILTETNRFEDTNQWHHCAPMVGPVYRWLTVFWPNDHWSSWNIAWKIANELR